MKKTYIQPSIEAIEMKYSTTLMAGSELGIGEGTMSASEALGRDSDLDDDF